jgi:acetolactate synthase-1/2/3 large subunit
MNLESVFAKFNNPDFVKLTESFGAIGYNVKSKDFTKILQKAKDSRHIPVIISIDVDYSRNRILVNDTFNG